MQADEYDIGHISGLALACSHLPPVFGCYRAGGECWCILKDVNLDELSFT